MKTLNNIKILLLSFVFLCSVFITSAQNSSSVSTNEKWYKPSYVNLQYAGQIGFMAVGIGKSYSNNKLETSLLYGNVPKSLGGSNINIVTLKQTYSPFTISLSQERIKLHLITTGFFISHHLGEDYNKYLTHQYPDNYYGFMKGYRLGAFIGGDINAELNPKSSLFFSSLSLYYELGINDLDADRLFRNPNQMKVHEITNLALGIKLYFK